MKTKSLIERHRYPGFSSVPDPKSPDRWRNLDSDGAARWQIAWGERVLREHPLFVYRDEVRVLVALSQMSLGMKEEARKTLDELLGTLVEELPRCVWQRNRRRPDSPP